MTPPHARHGAGRPTGTRAWRHQVAAAAGALSGPTSGVALDFFLPPTAWVDVDTLAENTLAGLRDAGTLPARFGGVDAVLATKQARAEPGADITLADAARLIRRRPPGPAAVEVTWDRAPRPADRPAKREWRKRIAAQWGERAPLSGDVWADVALGISGSLLGPLEVVVDALEPVLGRDPRGRDWQEFFPNDHRILWLRVHRVPRPALRLRVGPLPD